MVNYDPDYDIFVQDWCKDRLVKPLGNDIPCIALLMVRITRVMQGMSHSLMVWPSDLYIKLVQICQNWPLCRLKIRKKKLPKKNFFENFLTTKDWKSIQSRMVTWSPGIEIPYNLWWLKKIFKKIFFWIFFFFIKSIYTLYTAVATT